MRTSNESLERPHLKAVPRLNEDIDNTKTESGSKIFSREIQSFKEILRKMGDELDQFFESPQDYDRKKLEGLVIDFIQDLRNLLVDSALFNRIKASLESKNSNWPELLKPLKIFFRTGDVDDFGLDPEFELAIKAFFDFMYFKYFRVSVKGISNVPDEGRCILVANHSGVIPWDGAMLKVALFNEHPAKRDLRFLVDDFVFHFPFLGTLMNRIGGVRACPENALRLLSKEEVVSVFPEGIKGISKLFKDRYKLERFGRGGVIRLAFKSCAPIIPVSIVGAEEIYPLLYKSHVLARPLGLPFIPLTPLFPLLGPLGAIPLPTKWSIQFGEAIHYEADAKDLNDDIRINRETEKLRKLIQDMLLRQLEERTSVFSF